MISKIKENGIFILNTEQDEIALPENYIDIIKPLIKKQ